MYAHEKPPFSFVRLLLLAGVIAVALFNGQWFSGGRWSGPVFDFLSYWLTPFVRGTPLGTGMAPVYLTSVLLSLLTFVISRVPAALYERLISRRRSTVASMLIWLAAAALLTYPAYKAWQDAL